MQKQTSSSLLLVAAIAGGVGFVAFVALTLVGGFTLSPAVFLAILVAGAAAVFLFAGFHKSAAEPHPSLTPAADGQLGNRTRQPGTAGVTPGSAGVTPGSIMDDPVNTTLAARTLGTAQTAPDTTTATAGAAIAANAGGADTGAGADSSDAGAAPSDAAATGATGDGSDQKWKSTQVEGTNELASRKGEWRYDNGTEGAGTGGAASDSADAATPDADAAEAPVGKEPERLETAREGGPDDLKRIKGIGPKMETMLHGMGFFHFDQVAGWSDAELAWVDSNLDGFKGRASRDEWVAQAKLLASGAETDFSKKVDDGSVY